MKKKLLITLITVCTMLFALGMVNASAETEGIYTYSISDGKATITSCDTFASGDIIIPDTLGGYPVTNIGTNAFRVHHALTSIVISNGIANIGDGAFAGCGNLKSIAIPDSVTNIGNSAFSYCSELEKITTGKRIINIGREAFYNTAYYNNSLNWENNVLYIGSYLIKANTSIYGEYNIKNGTITIADEAFYQCEYLTNIVIPNSVTSIGADAFYYCRNIESITIPDSVLRIGDYAFSSCNKLSKVNITDLTRWCNIDFGEGYSANPLCFAKKLYLNNELITELIIPDNVTSIGDSAFLCCSSLISITIPDNVTSIGIEAFKHCENLKSVTISDSVTSIGDEAFYNCGNLKDVYYNNTADEWKKISIGSYNDALVNATFHYVQVEYSINEITINDMSGNNLQAIPTGTFLATVSFTNVSSSEDSVIILAEYTDAGAYKGLMYIQTEDVPIGSTIKLSIPVDNSNGDVAKLKAFCWKSFGSASPIGKSVSFPAE